MKQLLHIDNPTQSFVVALNDRAFCGLSLQVPQQQQQQQASLSSSSSEPSCCLFELLPPVAPSCATGGITESSTPRQHRNEEQERKQSTQPTTTDTSVATIIKDENNFSNSNVDFHVEDRNNKDNDDDYDDNKNDDDDNDNDDNDDVEEEEDDDCDNDKDEVDNDDDDNDKTMMRSSTGIHNNNSNSVGETRLLSSSNYQNESNNQYLNPNEIQAVAVFSYLLNNSNSNSNDNNNNNYNNKISSDENIHENNNNNNNNNNDDDDTNQINLMKTRQEDRVIWCAVARYDKTLSLYRIDSSITSISVTKDPILLHPQTVHRTSKRCSSLCFAMVPPPPPLTQSHATSSFLQQQQQQQQQKIPPLPVVISGDLAGDAVAFALDKQEKDKETDGKNNNNNSNNNKNSYDDDDDNNDNNLDEHKVATHSKRLLLGHTASMLTGVMVVGSEQKNLCCCDDDEQHQQQQQQQQHHQQMPKQMQQQWMITCDRDEKIRISSFPNTYTILGYLLGHTSFISCIDCCYCNRSDSLSAVSLSSSSSSATPIPTSTSTETKTWCVSISGDQTIRLWDYTTFEQLASTTWGTTTITADIAPDNDANNKSKEKSNVGSIGDSGGKLLAPSRVAINDYGDTIASIYEDCTCIDIWSVYDSGTENTTIESNYTSISKNNPQSRFELKCIVSKYDIGFQPLAIQFCDSNTILVLARDPVYIQLLKIVDINTSRSASASVSASVSASANNNVVIDDVTNDSIICQRLRNVAIGGERHTSASAAATTTTTTTTTTLANKRIIMPHSLLERDPRNQKMKLEKLHEQRGGSCTKPWNNVGRKDTARERTRRMRKRKRKRHINNNNNNAATSTVTADTVTAVLPDANND